jgi:elongation factor Ts
MQSFTIEPQVLLEQPFMKDPTITVEQYVKSCIGRLGENIHVARFVRYNLGESSQRAL